MRAHARAIAEHLPSDDDRRRTPWLRELVGTRRSLSELARYPVDDVLDPHTGGQFFLHGHDRATHGFAHFHCFVRLPGSRYGTARPHVTTHLAAVAMDSLGWPTGLICTNQWVTDELWQPARRTLALIEHFKFAPDLLHGATGRLLQGILHVHWPELRNLLANRDARLRAVLADRPASNVLQDRTLEVVVARRIDLRRRVRQLLL